VPDVFSRLNSSLTLNAEYMSVLCMRHSDQLSVVFLIAPTSNHDIWQTSQHAFFVFTKRTFFCCWSENFLRAGWRAFL